MKGRSIVLTTQELKDSLKAMATVGTLILAMIAIFAFVDWSVETAIERSAIELEQIKLEAYTAQRDFYKDAGLLLKAYKHDFRIR